MPFWNYYKSKLLVITASKSDTALTSLNSHLQRELDSGARGLQVEIMSFPPHITVTKEGDIHRATCLRCGFNGTSHDLKKLERVIQDHTCKVKPLAEKKSATQD